MQVLFINVRNKDAAHADKLFAQALESARSDYDPGLLFGLSHLAYPNFAREPWMLPPLELRHRFLDLLSEALLRVPQSEEEQTKICQLWRDGSRVLKNYPPQQIGTLQPILDDCKKRVPAFKGDTAEFEAKLETSDDWLRVAEEESDARVRAHHKLRAAIKAKEEKDVIRALEIANGLTEDERKAYPGSLIKQRNFELEAVLELCKRRDFPALQQVMDKSPQRPVALLTAARILFAQKDETTGMLLLIEARRALEKMSLDEPHFYWNFLNSYAAHMPSEAAAVFKEAVVGLNRIKPLAPDAEFSWGSLAYDLRPLETTPKLIDLDPEYLTAAVKVLESPQDRTTVRLSLLSATLRRHENEELEQRHHAPAKPQGRDNLAPPNH